MKKPINNHRDLRIEVAQTHNFVEVTEEFYYDSLEVLPPIWLENGCFMVDEPYSDDIYYVFGRKDDKFYGCLCNKNFALKNFNTDFSKNKANAYLAYLELCNTINEIPQKEVYLQIKDCENNDALDVMKIFIDRRRAEFDKESSKANIVNKKPGFWSRFFK
ncbi:hypothetical protein [Chryseobacterium viscerum]|uniref:Uncharacterized protein n=1 Tax=Chryseobacterium viscerum TaxID=1037377 RepID=A0A5N4BK29_9FLAO|nr:hypothetical protein [Chryseobacterium viscerum]KAB1228465.1 hypothetical protein F8D52_22590 [Chryseobacterium viscerum]